MSPLSSPFLDAFREKLARGEMLTHDEASQLLSAHDTLLEAYHDVELLARPALPAPEPPLDSTNFGLLTRATELLMANEREYAPSNAASDWYLRDQRVLALVREVMTRGAAPAPPDPK